MVSPCAQEHFTRWTEFMDHACLRLNRTGVAGRRSVSLFSHITVSTNEPGNDLQKYLSQSQGPGGRSAEPANAPPSDSGSDSESDEGPGDPDPDPAPAGRAPAPRRTSMGSPTQPQGPPGSRRVSAGPRAREAAGGGQGGSAGHGGAPQPRVVSRRSSGTARPAGPGNGPRAGAGRGQSSGAKGARPVSEACEAGPSASGKGAGAPASTRRGPGGSMAALSRGDTIDVVNGLRKLNANLNTVDTDAERVTWAFLYRRDAGGGVCVERDMVVCSNATGVAAALHHSLRRAVTLFEAGAYIHWYERQGATPTTFKEAFGVLQAVIDCYTAVTEPRREREPPRGGGGGGAGPRPRSVIF